jgi:flagellar assembly protein FliH
MSSRARIVPSADVERFDWNTSAAPPKPSAAAGAAAGPNTMVGGGRPLVDPQTLAQAAAALAAPGSGAAPAATVSQEQVRLEHQAHLAALEREAFAKGYAQGERAGIEAGGKRAEAMLRRVAQTLTDLASLRETLIQQTERQMVQLSITIARRIVHREVSLDPELIAAMAHVALKKLGTSSPATIRLHPEDYTVVAHEGETWGNGNVKVVPDPAVARGGCLVESEFGRIDASIERQLEEMSRALLGDGHD